MYIQGFQITVYSVESPASKRSKITLLYQVIAKQNTIVTRVHKQTSLSSIGTEFLSDQTHNGQ